MKSGRILRRIRKYSPSDQALLSVVILGLVAAVSDGKPENIEVQTLRDNLSNLYSKNSEEVLSLIQVALKCLKNSDPVKLSNASCNLLKEELNQSQLLEIFDFLSDILVADGKVESGEEEYLADVAEKFDLTEILRSIIPRIERNQPI